MKKIIIAALFLLTLVMTLALPIAAEEPADTTAAEITATETTAAETTAAETTAAITEAETEAEETTEAAPKTNFGFDLGTLSETLPIMGMGMLGIFLVIGTIALTVVLLSKLPGKEEE